VARNINEILRITSISNKILMNLFNKTDKSSAVAEIGDRLVTIGMGRKWGGAAVGAGSPLVPI